MRKRCDVDRLVEMVWLHRRLGRRPPTGLKRRIARHDGQYAIASLVVAELRFGAQRHPDPVRRERLNAFVDGVVSSTPVLAFDARAGEWLGVERARLEVAGTPSISPI